MFTIKVTKFERPHPWASKVLRRTWESAQLSLLHVGYKTAHFMREYLRSNVHRKSLKTDQLVDHLLLTVIDTTAKIHWGIGNIEELNNTNHAYWNILNYGIGFIPNNGRPVKGAFIPSGKPDGALTGKGTEAFTKNGPYFMTPKTPIRVVPYIDESNAYLTKILQDLGRKISSYGFKPFAGSK